MNDPRDYLEFIGARHRLERDRWAIGPWDEEADGHDWRDEGSELPCRTRRHHVGGHWCGFVGVPAGYRISGKAAPDCLEPEAICRVRCPREACWDHVMRSTLDVHGQVAFAGYILDNLLWHIGFHAGHEEDVRPADTFGYRVDRIPYPFGISARYRTEAYVRGECARLARQIQALEGVVA